MPQRRSDGYTHGMADYDDLKKVGQELAARERMQEEDTLWRLARGPKRAADAMVELFEGTLFCIEHPFFENDDELDEDQKARLKKELDDEIAKFWKRCDELVGRITGHPERPEFDP